MKLSRCEQYELFNWFCDEQKVFKELIEMLQKNNAGILIELFQSYPEALNKTHRMFFATIEEFLIAKNGEISLPQSLRKKLEEEYDLELNDFIRAEHHLTMLGILEIRFREKGLDSFVKMNNGFYQAHKHLFAGMSEGIGVGKVPF